MNRAFFDRRPFGGMFCRRGGEGLSGGAGFVSVDCGWVDVSWSVGILGSCDFLGSWAVDRVVLLNNSFGSVWSVDFGGVSAGVEYKFVIVDSRSGCIVGWEDGVNRVYGGRDDCDVKSWRGNALWRGAGVAIPLFSLRSEMSCGIGDFADLGRFAIWAAQAGLRIVQLLPINDTTRTHTSADSYPYNAISVDALHPLYLSLEWMEGDSGGLQDPDVAHSVADRGQQLNRLDGVDYEGVSSLKWDFFRAMYSQEGRAVLDSSCCRSFVSRNRRWLYPYALFSYLRDENGTADFDTWGDWREWDEDRAAQLLNPVESSVYDKIAIYIYLQFHADSQMKRALRMAHTCGVALKGDLPIGVSRHSVETWVSPEFFNLDCSAGAPPDAFSEGGQNWGFPTYNWDLMRDDGFSWWRDRFGRMDSFFDLYRIDHVLGFFRIWEIPNSVCSISSVSDGSPAVSGAVSGLLGHFYPALGYPRQELLDMGFKLPRSVFFDGNEDVLFVADHRLADIFHPRIDGSKTRRYRSLDDGLRFRYDLLYEDYFYRRNDIFWSDCALERLPVLVGSSGMTCCAEDLGMIPGCVEGVLSGLDIVTLEVDRMPKQLGYLWGDVANYPYLSVATTSTHDTSTLRGLFLEAPAYATAFVRDCLGLDSGGAVGDPSASVCRMAVERILCSPSIFAIFPLQDLLSLSGSLRSVDPLRERINDPSDGSHYWRYRMPLTIDQLYCSSSFSIFLRDLICGSGRVV